MYNDTVCDETILWHWMKYQFEYFIYVTGKIMNKETEKGKCLLLKTRKKNKVKTLFETNLPYYGFVI